MKVSYNVIDSDPLLKRLIELLKSYNPERIILFGSRARGEADEYSDYDIIVIKQTEKPFMERLKDMIPYLAQFESTAEILVYTPEEFEKMKEFGLGFIAQKEGIILYESESDRS